MKEASQVAQKITGGTITPLDIASFKPHPCDPPGTGLAISSRCKHCFSRTEADIQLHTQFPGWMN